MKIKLGLLLSLVISSLVPSLAGAGAQQEAKAYFGAGLVFGSDFVSTKGSTYSSLPTGIELRFGLATSRWDLELNNLNFSGEYLSISTETANNSSSGPSYRLSSWMPTLRFYLMPQDSSPMNVYLSGGIGILAFTRQGKTSGFPAAAIGLGSILIDNQDSKVYIHFSILRGGGFDSFGATNMGFLYRF